MEDRFVVGVGVELDPGDVNSNLATVVVVIVQIIWTQFDYPTGHTGTQPDIPKYTVRSR